MADRTVRAIFEARVSGAQKGMRDLSTDVDKAGKKVDGLTKDLKTLDGQKVKPKIDVAIDDAKKRVRDLTIDLGTLRTLKVTPLVEADIKDTQRKLREAKAQLRELNGAKAEIKVTADTSDVDKALDGLGGAGKDAGEEAGGNVASGILDALRSIPIAGAVVGVGAAIAGGLLLGIKQGLAVEAERDFFSAQTGLDEETSARFGRAAGEAYANAWGDSVAGNLNTARLALQAGLIDADATDAEIEQVIASLSGIADIMEEDVQPVARATGQLLRTGLAKNTAEAFDILVAGYQKGGDASQDLLDTMTEYPALFERLGLSGKDAMGLIVQGLEAGARNSDLAADALKEFQIRATDGSKLSAQGFKALGLSAEEMTAKIAKGGEGAREGLDQVLDGLREIEDPVKRNAAGVALFGTQWEDLGDALLAMDVTTAADQLDGVAGSAGAAERALATMSDNTSTKIESAKRNIEIAMDGIKGALAETFGDDIAGAADWVSKNRAPLMQFFLDVITGTIEMGRSFLSFSADAQDAVADVIQAIAEMIDALPGDQSELKTSMLKVADGLRSGADAIRSDVIPALDEAEDRAKTWAAPEILKARIHDATVKMTEDLKGFTEKVGEGDLDITINGDTVDAEEALAKLVENIDAETGTVLINGDSIPAEDALETLLGYIAEGEEDVTVGADTDPAQRRLRTFKGQVSAAEASMSIDADTAAAKRALAAITGKDYYATVRVNVVSNRISDRGLTGGQHDGGWITGGLHAGGRVPGSDPGYDNVLWPLNTGGKTLQQPLAGGEYVVNSKDATFWGPMLEWMNSGGRPVQTFNETSNAPVYIDKVVGLTLSEVEREAATRRRRNALDPAKGGSR